MTAENFKNFLQLQFPQAHMSAGEVDRSRERTVGIYRRGSNKSHNTLGGVANASYAIMPIQIYIHWTDKYNVCTAFADSVYDLLEVAETPVEMDGIMVRSIELIDPLPQDAGTDSNNICEKSILARIYYER